MTGDLPDGWASEPIARVFSHWGGMTPSTAQPRYWGGRVPWISSKDVKKWRVAEGTQRVTDLALTETRLRLCRAGAVLVVVRSGVLAHTLPVAIAAAPLVVNQDLKVFDSGDHALNEWLALYLQAHEREILEANRKDGTTVQSIRVPEILDRDLPVPPLPEQRRIVAKIEALLADVNAARERLARVPAILKRFRQSVIATACSGRLTEGWRLTRPCAPVTGAAPDFDVGDLPEVPATWVWRGLGYVGELNRGKSRHRPRDDARLYGGPYPFIQTGDVARSGGRVTSHSQTYSEFGLAQSRLWPARTACITIAANIADSAILTYPACFPDSVVGLIADPAVCVPEYVEYFIRTARADLSRYAPATAQKNINLEILRQVVVPLPPIDEQHEIVRRVEALFALADAVEQRVAAATRHADRVIQAILAKAFRGELVPTEAALASAGGRDFESAEALLARVRAAAAGSNDHARRRPRSRLARGPR